MFKNDGHIVWKSDGSIELRHVEANSFDPDKTYAPVFDENAYAPSVQAEKQSLNQKILDIATVVRELEEQLNTERNYSKQLREYSHRMRYEMAHLQKTEAELRKELANKTQKDGHLIEKARVLSEELTRLKTENEKLIDFNQKEKSKLEEVSKQSKKYQQDLHEALVRLHKTEARFSELAVELQKLEEDQKTCRSELVTIGESYKQEYEERLAKDRVTFQENFEKEMNTKVRMAREESHYLLRQKEEMIFDLNNIKTKQFTEMENLKAEIFKLKSDLSIEKSKNGLFQNDVLAQKEGMTRKDHKIDALTSELRALQEMISIEKSQLGSLIEKIKNESESGLQGLVDPKILVKILQSWADIQIIETKTSAQVKPVIPLPRNRFDS